MDAAVSKIKKALELRIDYGGQARAERTNQQVLIASGVIAFVVGFALQSVFVSMAIYTAGLMASALAIVPPWPHLQRHPIKWLPPIADNVTSTERDAVKKTR